jgi:transketolase
MNKYFIDKSKQLRLEVYDMCCKAGTGHVTSSFSCVEILTALYYDILRLNPKEPDWPGRDYFILSKGQASPLLYTVLADIGFYPKEWLNTFCQAGGKFGVHLQHSVPGVEFTTGSLGMGLSYACGLALGLKKDRRPNMVYVLLGDGELQEGQIWEAAMFASANRLNNIIGIVDMNGINATSFIADVLPQDDLTNRFVSFGWNVLELDGHNFDEIFTSFKYNRTRHLSTPTMIIAKTVKGQGVESICHDPRWHACCPVGDAIHQYRQELL